MQHFELEAVPVATTTPLLSRDQMALNWWQFYLNLLFIHEFHVSQSRDPLMSTDGIEIDGDEYSKNFFLWIIIFMYHFIKHFITYNITL